MHLICTILAICIGNTDATSYTCVFCLPGKYKSIVANDACLSCNANFYQPYAGMTDQSACQACTPNSVALSGSVAPTDCKCTLGYTGPDGGIPSPCASCVTGKFKSVDGSAACTNCAAYSNSAAASVASTACTCNAGYTGSDGGPCLGCAANYYKVAAGSAICTACSSNMNSPVNSTAQTECLCNPGFTGANGGPCTACPAGKWKVNSGSGACEDCVTGTYSVTVGKYDAICTTCPAFTSSAPGSSAVGACQCLAGYINTVNGAACTACVAGKYKTASGTASACTDCGLNTYSIVSAATGVGTCLYCEASFLHLITLQVGTSALAGCTCDAGWSGSGADGGYCYQCLPGTYKTLAGPQSCTPCAQGYYSTTPNATDGATCLTCTSNSYSASSSSASAACTCNTGYTGPGGDVCSVTGPTVNVALLSGVLVTASSTASGVTSVGVSAVSTPTFDPSYLINTYKNAMDIVYDTGTPIRPMALNGWTSATTTGVHFAVLDMGTAKTIQTVTLYWHDYDANAAWTYDEANVNIKIQVGSSNSIDGNANCASGINSPRLRGDIVSSSVVACVATGRYVFVILPATAGSTSRAMSIQEVEVSSTPMQCGCIACVAGTYKGATGSVICTNCDVGKYSTTVAATGLGVCVNCPAGSTSVAGTDALLKCTCPAGWTGADGGACTQCGAGKYKVGTGPGACIDCGIDTYSTTLAATGSGTCLTCSSLQTNGGVSKAPGTGNSAATACKCDVGYTGGDGSACSACTVGYYKNTQGSVDCTACGPNTYQPATAQTSCTACPSYSVSATGTTALTGCLCGAGYTGPNGGLCRGCYAGTYKTSAGTAACTLCGNATYSGTSNATTSSVCTPCPQYTLSYAGSQVLGDCKCDFGYYTQNMSTPIMSCQQCLPGTYNSELGVIACSKCTAGQYAANYGSVSSENCLTCAAGTWSAEGKAQCEACAPNAYSLIASGAQTDCKCNAGYTGGDGGPCNYCETGKYKTEIGSAACTLCGVNKYSSSIAATAAVTCLPCFDFQQSLAGSDAENDCKCNMGYTSTVAGADGPACIACALGKYKDVKGYDTCTSCGPNTYADVTGSIHVNNCTTCFENSVTNGAYGSISVDDCICTGGYQRQ